MSVEKPRGRWVPRWVDRAWVAICHWLFGPPSGRHARVRGKV